MTFNQFDKRIVETLKIRDKVENDTGERKFYKVHILELTIIADFRPILHWV